jgi:hypothetical protein
MSKSSYRKNMIKKYTIEPWVFLACSEVALSENGYLKQKSNCRMTENTDTECVFLSCKFQGCKGSLFAPVVGIFSCIQPVQHRYAA